MPPKDIPRKPEKELSPLSPISASPPDCSFDPFSAPVDLTKYAVLLDDVDASHDEKLALLSVICLISLQFIELAYGVGPTPKTCGQVKDAHAHSAAAADAMVSSDQISQDKARADRAEGSGS